MEHDYETLALAFRERLQPGISPTERLPLLRLLQDTPIDTLRGPMIVRVIRHFGIPEHLYGITTFEPSLERAWVWLNRAAYPEFIAGVGRTSFTVAHEAGHAILHADEISDLTVRAEPDHKARLESEANRFAAHALVPDAALRKLDRADITHDLLVRRFGVTPMMAVRRLLEWGSSPLR